MNDKESRRGQGANFMKEVFNVALEGLKGKKKVNKYGLTNKK